MRVKGASMRGALVAAILAGTALGTGFAAVAQTQDVTKRVNKLEREMSAVQRKVFGRGYVPPVAEDEGPVEASPLANLEVRVHSMESRLQQLTGQIEELRYKNEQLQGRLESYIADAEFRFNQLEGKEGAAPMGGGSTTSSSTGSGELEEPSSSGSASEPASSGTASNAVALPGGTPIEQYNYSYALLSSGKYTEAENAFKAFLEQHPQDELAGNAQYWLGQIYFVRGEYDQAAKTFLEGYQAYPKSSKAPDYLLKIGSSLTKIDQKADACAVFAELRSKFPNSPAAKERLAGERKAAGC